MLMSIPASWCDHSYVMAHQRNCFYVNLNAVIIIFCYFLETKTYIYPTFVVHFVPKDHHKFVTQGSFKLNHLALWPELGRSLRLKSFSCLMVKTLPQTHILTSISKPSEALRRITSYGGLEEKEEEFSNQSAAVFSRCHQVVRCGIDCSTWHPTPGVYLKVMLLLPLCQSCQGHSGGGGWGWGMAVWW